MLDCASLRINRMSGRTSAELELLTSERQHKLITQWLPHTLPIKFPVFPVQLRRWKHEPVLHTKQMTMLQKHCAQTQTHAQVRPNPTGSISPVTCQHIYWSKRRCVPFNINQKLNLLRMTFTACQLQLIGCSWDISDDECVCLPDQQASRCFYKDKCGHAYVYKQTQTHTLAHCLTALGIKVASWTSR